MKLRPFFPRYSRIAVCAAPLMICAALISNGADRSLSQNPELKQYFEDQVSKIERDNSLLNYATISEWQEARIGLRQQLFDMLGLNPIPESTPLNAKVTGIVNEADFRVEKLHFQSMPGLYVTANLYLPKEINKPLPAVLYVCGHARVKEGDVSFGNKAGYQHHGAWYARNGYACLTIDTLQLGEIEGIHHGTYRHNRWWWNAHGYTPAGVEAWNCIRALDYLETRSEVDTDRIGVTGRSGGGAYSWWIAALDDRIKCAVPVAGITTLRNHIVDGCIEGHCDCMYMTNRFRWDYATVAALVAPRPLLISNSDKDSIFPLDGVVEIHRQLRHIYNLYGKPFHLGLQITEGPHKDTQELRVHAFRWMNRWLRNDDSLIENTATKFFEPQQLRVFEELAADERNTRIDEEFITLAKPPNQAAVDAILKRQEDWIKSTSQILKQRCFTAWPSENPSAIELKSDQLVLTKHPKISATRIMFQSEDHVTLFVDIFRSAVEKPAQTDPASVQLMLPSSPQWNDLRAAMYLGAASPVFESITTTVLKDRGIVAVFFPRGSGPSAWHGDERKQIQIRRRFQLLGTTLDAMRVWDIRCAISAIKSQIQSETKLAIKASGRNAWLGLLAAITDPAVQSVNCTELAMEKSQMAVFPDIARQFSAEELIAIALARSDVQIQNSPPSTSILAAPLSNDPRWTGGSLNIK